jgi:predicted nucleic acid-binding protein
VVVAAEKSPHQKSPNKEYLRRWLADEFELLFSDDTLHEYIEKMEEKQVSETAIHQLIGAILELGKPVEIEFFHFPVYPVDVDDIAFFLCAHNGAATHLISYDSDLTDLNDVCPFFICEPVAFLEELRTILTNVVR